MPNPTYDAIVIGGGPGGYVAGIRLGQLGQRTLVVEREAFGGVCLNWGCIPSKALIAATELVEKLGRASEMGIDAGPVHVDVPRLQAWKDAIVKKLTGGVRSLVKGAGCDIALGTAELAGPRTVRVTGADGAVQTFEATKGVIVATGAEVVALPGFAPDGQTILTAREAVSLQAAPKSLAILGGGVIGLELGMVYQRLGTKLVIVEMMPALLPGVDADLVKVVEKHLKKAGAEILTETKATGVERTAGGVALAVEVRGERRTIEAEKVLVAVGFKPRSRGLGLEALGVKLDARGHIVADDTLQSSVPGVYAIGDVAGPPYLAHKASKEGEIAAEHLAGRKAARDWRAMPAAIFTHPEIAVVGLTETQAKAEGRAVRVGKFPFAALGKAMAMLETDGFVKVLVDPESHETLGVAIVGPKASDLISEAALALEMCAAAEDVALTVHPHPTLGESMMEAFKHALGEAIHVPNR